MNNTKQTMRPAASIKSQDRPSVTPMARKRQKIVIITDFATVERAARWRRERALLPKRKATRRVLIPSCAVEKFMEETL